MKLSFRQAGAGDIALLQKLARRIWDEAYGQMLSKGQIDYMLRMMYSDKVVAGELLNGVVWELIVIDGEQCGYLSYKFEGDDAVKLSKIYIDKKYRGTALAADCLQRVKNYAAMHGKGRVFLTVNKNNKQAIRAYEKNGFAITDSVVSDIGQGFVMDDYIMACSVGDGQKWSSAGG